MSASHLVDLNNTTQMIKSVDGAGAGSGCVFAASGAIVGDVCDMLNANTYCNLFVAGTANFTSGLLRVAVQSSPNTTSGNFTDPTSGLQALPSNFSSGGILWINSGSTGGGVLYAFQSGQAVLSGFMTGAAFQRPNRYVRAIVLSGDFYAGPLVAGFISQLKTTTSGTGFSWSPQSGTSISV